MLRSPRVLLVLSAASFGGTWVAAPWAVAEIPPLAVACVRFALAAVLLFAWCRARGLRIDARLADLPIVLGVAATSIVGYNILFLYGVGLASPSHGAVIVPGFIPVVTLVLARALLGDRIVATQGIGAALAIVGLVLVVGPAFAGGSDELAGDLMFVGGAVTWAAYTILARAATKRFNAAVITLLGAAVGAVAFAVMSLLLEPGGFGAYGTASLQALAGVAYLGSIGTVVSFVFFYLGVQRIGAARAAAYAVLIPLFGVAATVTLLGEALDPLALAGAAVVIGGLWLMQARRPAAVEEAGAEEAGAEEAGRASG